MKNAKEKIQTILDNPNQFPMNNKEKFLVNHYLNDFQTNLFHKTIESDEDLELKLLDNIYGLLSCASFHEKSHEDWYRGNKVICYLLILFHDNDKIRTMISIFFKTQESLDDWYEAIRPFLRSWNIPGWKGVKDFF